MHVSIGSALLSLALMIPTPAPECDARLASVQRANVETAARGPGDEDAEPYVRVDLACPTAVGTGTLIMVLKNARGENFRSYSGMEDHVITSVVVEHFTPGGLRSEVIHLERRTLRTIGQMMKFDTLAGQSESANARICEAEDFVRAEYMRTMEDRRHKLDDVGIDVRAVIEP